MSVTKKCGKTTTPKVDNTLHKCDNCGYINFDCIVVDFSIPYLGIMSGDSLTKTVNSIKNNIIAKGNKISKLENYYKPTEVITSNYIILEKDTCIYFKPTSAAGNAILPVVNTLNQGREITFINHSGAIKTLGTYRTTDSTTDTTIVNNIVLKLKAIGTEWIKI